MESKTLITGKTGSVGRNLDFGVGFPSLKYDLTNQSQVIKMFDENGPFDRVVHCAAKVGGLGFHLSHQYDLFYQNAMINTNILHECKNRKIQRVLSFLSSCIFSDTAKSPYTEEEIHEGFPFKVHYPYGQAKRMLEIQSRICFEECGLIYNCVIPTNMYGKNDSFNMEDGHVVAVLIHRAYKAYNEKTDFIVWGDGKQKRNLLYFDDISKLTKWTLDNYLDKEPLIFSDNNPVEIGYVAELIADFFNIKNKLKFDTSKPSGQKIRELSGNKLKSLTNFQFTPIEEGIKQTAEWFVNNYPNIRL